MIAASKRESQEWVIITKFFVYMVTVSALTAALFAKIYGKSNLRKFKQSERWLKPLMLEILKENFPPNELAVIKKWMGTKP